MNFEEWISNSEFPIEKFKKQIMKSGFQKVNFKSEFQKVSFEKWVLKSDFQKVNFQKWILSIFIINKLNSQVNYLISNFKRKSGVNSKPLIKNKSFSLPYHND